MKKSPEQIKKQLEFWFLANQCQERETFSGNESFTLFDLVDRQLQTELLKEFELRTNEIPVLLLRICTGAFVVNTTERFVKIDTVGVDEIEYREFDKHQGFTEYKMIWQGFSRAANVKVNGLIKEFVIELKEDSHKTWMLPTGDPGFSFWNVTNRCELIGRKYLA